METTGKISGFLLLFLGLAVIFYSLYSSFNIFTAKTEAPEIFVLEKQDSVSGGSLQIELQEAISEQLKGFLPANSLPKLFNLLAWSIFAGILIFAGTQVSILGIKLIK
ncbi:MAG: hypothetical protein ABH800_00170 [Candidatus Nealsonbacteria bacterium]